MLRGRGTSVIAPKRFFRLCQINWILFKYIINPKFIPERYALLRFLSYFNPLGWHPKHNRAEGVRIAMEKLGPIFVKFGQVLSTRPDLFPEDIIEELSKLQDRVPPFPGEQAKQRIEKTYQKNIHELFATFDIEPLASASVAQVHAAKLADGSDVIVKILRPNIARVIDQDIALLYMVAGLMLKMWKQAYRLRPKELVNEFQKTILNELDLLREAANASLLRRNFADSNMMYVPEVHWSYARKNMMVMERVYGYQISDIETFKAKSVNLKRLAEYGVEIFFTQVFRDSFFHADMHPGNIFVDITDPNNPKYLGVDFGIMGSLDDRDKNYLAENILAFFHRDYKRVAELHVQSGWVPPDTRVDDFQSAIRTVCEPIFEKPLKEISFGQILLRLFQTAEQFNMVVQPQLMLLQKTLLNVEGLGRTLYPDLDLWETAQPFIEKFMKQQKSLKKFLSTGFKQLPPNAEKLLQLPELLNEAVGHYNTHQRMLATYQIKEHRQIKQNQKRGIAIGIGVSLLVISVLQNHRVSDWLANHTAWPIIAGIAGLAILFFAWNR